MNPDPTVTNPSAEPESTSGWRSQAKQRTENPWAKPAVSASVATPAGLGTVEPSEDATSTQAVTSNVEAPDEPSPGGSLALLLAFVAAFVAIGVFRSWAIPAIVAGLLFTLFMHELGHYITARISGMKVTEFFLGFGPRIWSFRRGETEYGIKGIPAGAYVRIIGMTNLDDIDPADEHRTYRAQPYWQRMMTIVAGSAMHFAMAIVSLIVLFGAFAYNGFNGPEWQVERVVAGSSADEIGVEAGDSIVRFNGEGFDTWTDFGAVVSMTELGPIEVEVERDGERLVLDGELGPRPGDVLGAGFGVLLEEDRQSQAWVLEAVRTGGPAEDLGVEIGDVILVAGETARPTDVDLSAELRAAEGTQMTLLVLRDEVEVDLSGVIELDRTQAFRGFLGVGPEFIERGDTGWLQAIGLGFGDFATVLRSNVVGLLDLVNPLNYFGSDEAPTPAPVGAVPAPPVAVPDDDSNRPVSVIGVGRLFADSQSVDQALFLFALVNIFVGLFNLLPVLPLDGGHAAMATYQKVRRVATRNPEFQVNAAKLLPITWVVVALLVVVGGWAAVLDIFAWPA